MESASEKHEQAKACDDQIAELNHKITTWHLHMAHAPPVDAACLQEEIRAAYHEIADLQAKESMLFDEVL